MREVPARLPVPDAVRRIGPAAALTAALAAILPAIAVSAAAPRATVRVSVSTAGAQATGHSFQPSVSANGRFVAFASRADDVVPGDAGGLADVFVRDVVRGTVVRVSVTPSGGAPDAECTAPAISGNGRYVAFVSSATNLVPGVTSGRESVYVRDLRTGSTTCVSLAPAGGEPDGGARLPSVSANGRWVAFRSSSSNLVEGDTNQANDVFVHDRKTGRTVRASTDAAGRQAAGGGGAPRLAPGGRHVGFTSDSTDLVADDRNGVGDVFVKDLRTGGIVRASVGDAGNEADGASFEPALSSNGRFVAFGSSATNLVRIHLLTASQIYLRDLKAGTTRRVSGSTNDVEGNGEVDEYAISPDGRFVAYSSSSDNIVADDGNGLYDLFVHDARRGTNSLVSRAADGGDADGDSNVPALSAGGRVVVYSSSASNLVPGDTNTAGDVFLLRLR